MVAICYVIPYAMCYAGSNMLNMAISISCKRLFCRLGRLARLRRPEYSCDCLLYHSCTLLTFLASETLQRWHIRSQYAKYGNIEDFST